jgi:uncharacterized Zn finger protein
MTLIQVRCPVCDVQDVRPGSMVIDVEASEYIFVCPNCGGVVARTYTDTVLNLLRTVGVITIEEFADRLLESET